MLYRLNSKYTIEFRMRPSVQGMVSLECEWSPRIPSKKVMERLHPAYVQARDRFIARVADQMGVPAVVIETTPEGAAALEAEMTAVRH